MPLWLNRDNYGYTEPERFTCDEASAQRDTILCRVNEQCAVPFMVISDSYLWSMEFSIDSSLTDLHSGHLLGFSLGIIAIKRIKR